MSFKPKKDLQERPEMEPGMVHYLLYGEMSTEPGVNRFLQFCTAKIEAAWEKIGESITRDYIKSNPGKRPWAWWEWSAPRWDDPFDDCWYHGTLPAPRQRIGGTGKPSFECIGDGPSFSFGLPDSWPTAVSAEMGLCEPGDVPDPDNPPTFESQASYLERHDLLTASEKRWLKSYPQAMEPEKIEISQ